MKLAFDNSVTFAQDMIDNVEAALENSSEVEMKDRFGRFSTDIIASYALGLEASCLKNPDAMFRKIGKKLFDSSALDRIKLFFAHGSPDTARKLGLKVNNNETSDFFMSSIKQTVEYRKKNNIQRNDSIDLLMQIDDHEKLNGDVGKLTLEEIAAQAFIFYLAGFETSSTAMTFAVYELAMNPEIQETLREEIFSVVGKFGGEITYDSLSEMKYLQMVIDGNNL